MSQTIVHLVEERRKYWRTLQYLAGLDVAKLDADHRAELRGPAGAVQRSAGGAGSRSIDPIARGDVANWPRRPRRRPAGGRAVGGARGSLCGRAPAAAPAAAKAATARRWSLADEDDAKCTNCKTCYQDLSELFEKTRIVVDGAAKEVGRLIPGVLERIR